MINNELASLLEKQETYLQQFKQSQLIQFIKSSEVDRKEARIKLLDCIQTFSDYFQKAVMLRAIFTEHSMLGKLAQEHLNEEFGHNTSLLIDRSNRPPYFDPVLDSTAAWFCWKMLTLGHLEKALLMHWVLESSAYLFFLEAHKVMEKYGETNYFKVHAEADEAHQHFDLTLLKNLTPTDYQNLNTVVEQGWQVLLTVCNQIAELSLS